MFSVVTVRSITLSLQNSSLEFNRMTTSLVGPLFSLSLSKQAQRLNSVTVRLGVLKYTTRFRSQLGLSEEDSLVPLVVTSHKCVILEQIAQQQAQERHKMPKTTFLMAGQPETNLTTKWTP